MPKDGGGEKVGKEGRVSIKAELLDEVSPNVRIDVAFGNNGKWGEREARANESAANGRVSESGSGKVSESWVAVGRGSGAGVGSIELVSLSMEQALW